MLARGGTRADLAHDIKKGFIVLLSQDHKERTAALAAAEQQNTEERTQQHESDSAAAAAAQSQSTQRDSNNNKSPARRTQRATKPVERLGRNDGWGDGAARSWSSSARSPVRPVRWLRTARAPGMSCNRCPGLCAVGSIFNLRRPGVSHFWCALRGAASVGSLLRRQATRSAQSEIRHVPFSTLREAGVAQAGRALAPHPLAALVVRTIPVPSRHWREQRALCFTLCRAIRES